MGTHTHWHMSRKLSIVTHRYGAFFFCAGLGIVNFSSGIPATSCSFSNPISRGILDEIGRIQLL